MVVQIWMGKKANSTCLINKVAIIIRATVLIKQVYGLTLADAQQTV